ncbi:MAG: hypothetical protein ACTSVI_12865 [Promethearchaeota archaeon]
MKKLRNYLIETFKFIFTEGNDPAIISKLPVKDLTTNPRILLSRDTTRNQDARTIIKIKKVFIAKLKNKNIEFILIIPDKEEYCFIGARLTKYGGHVAAYISKEISKKLNLNLVILNNNIIIFKNLKGMNELAINSLKRKDGSIKDMMTRSMERLQEANELFIEEFKNFFTRR